MLSAPMNRAYSSNRVKSCLSGDSGSQNMFGAMAVSGSCLG